MALARFTTLGLTQSRLLSFLGVGSRSIHDGQGWAQRDAGVPESSSSSYRDEDESTSDLDDSYPSVDSWEREGYSGRRTPQSPQKLPRLYPANITNVNSTLDRADLVHFFEGCNLPEDEVRCVYHKVGEEFG
jgi:hypothetical protein